MMHSALVQPICFPLPSDRKKALRKLNTRRNTEPEVFTFDPIPSPTYGRKYKRRSLKILYPIYQPRKTIPAEKDVVKRLLLFLLSIVALQVYLTPVAHLDERLPVPERQELGLKCESFLHPWPLWMGYSTTSALCSSPQQVQVNITCPTVHTSHIGT
ncbi:radiation-inducible immediate-early gene IEX-1-like [Amblyraja radiata]|uniref:radiation-inducible immediate-early gene IEX-1-like n=1 Tax=Amblyraja radiata TaxID=386614 RepID=UPI001402D730|nr:radiation-inducible immediate-early gene IEX-1-like [Amblyraja radiata]